LNYTNRVLSFVQPLMHTGEQMATQISFDNEISETRTLIEVETEDRLGLLYAISQTFAELSVDIAGARIVTERGAAIDSFYVRELDGEAHIGERAQHALKRRVIGEALDERRRRQFLHHEERQSVGVAADRLHLRTEHQPGPRTLHTLGEGLRELAVQQRQQPPPPVDQGHLDAEGGEDRGVLAGDDAAAQHHHRARLVRQAQYGIAVEDVFVVDLDGSDVPRPRSGGEKHARRSQYDSRTVEALHLDAIRIQEDRAPANFGNALSKAAARFSMISLS